MVDTPGFYRPEVKNEMLRILTPSRPEVIERRLDPEELAAVQRAEIERLVAEERNQQRLQEIQARRPGFQALMSYGAQQVNPISQARAAKAGMGEAERRLEHPIYQKFIGDLITRAANVQEPAAVNLAHLIMGNQATAPAPAPATAVIAPARSGDLAQMYEGYSLPNRPAPPETADAARWFDTGIGSAPAVQRAVQVARQSAGVPVPPQRPDSLAPQPPSAEAAMAARANAVRDAWTQYNDTGSAADFVRASALMQANVPERQQEADGGTIKAKSTPKPDAIHKALEIIHHLLTNGR